MLPLVVALQLAGSFSFEDRTEVRARGVTSPTLNQDGALRLTPDNRIERKDTALVLDLETNPEVRFRLAKRAELDSLTLAYAPRIVLANFAGAGASQGGDTTVDLVHRPMLTLEKAFDARNRFALNALLQTGSTTPGTLLLPERWNGRERPPAPRAFPLLPFAQQSFLAIYVAGGVTHTFSQRTMANFGLQYITFGQPTKDGRVATGGTTYMQNPAVVVDVFHNLKPTDTLMFRIAPQLNIVQASPQAVDANGTPLASDGRPMIGADGAVRPLRDEAGNVVRGPDGLPVPIGAQHINRTFPITYQLSFEARYRKQLAPMTAYELAAGANVLYRNMPRTVINQAVLNERGEQVMEADPANPGQQRGVTRAVEQDDPLKLRQDGSAGAQTRLNVLPVGELLFDQGFSSNSAKGRFLGYTRTDAWINTVSGAISARWLTVGAVNLDFGRNAVRAQAAFVQSLPLTADTTLFRQVVGELSYQRTLSDSWYVDFGVRLGYQDAALNQTVRASVIQPGAFAGVGFRPLPAKF